MNNLISSQESDFRHSIVTALLHSTDNWAFNIDKANINTDFLKSEEYRRPWYSLVYKLKAYGIKGSTLHLFQLYLFSRTQKCIVHGSIAESKSLASDIPQGTILCPLLFILYTNELPKCLYHSEPQMYADDTHLTFAGNNLDIIEQKLN